MGLFGKKEVNTISEMQYNDIVSETKKELSDNLNNAGIRVVFYTGEILKDVITKNKHSTTSKIVATGLFGLMGLVGTSGIKQSNIEKAETIDVNLAFREKGILLESSNSKLNNMRLPWDEIVYSTSEPTLTLVDATKLKFGLDYGYLRRLFFNNFSEGDIDKPIKIIGDKNKIPQFHNELKDFFAFLTNQNSCGKIEDGWDSPITTNKDNMINDNNAYCQSCGTKITLKNSNFCMECGEKL
ncbi:MAG: hypothetical protein ACRC1M_04390 [Methanobacteriaceae archaeon]